MKLYEQVSDELFLEINKLSEVFGSKTKEYDTLRRALKYNKYKKYVHIGDHKFINEEAFNFIIEHYEETGFLYLILPFEDYVSQPYVKNPTKEEREKRKAEREARRKEQEKLKAEREAKRKEQEQKKLEKEEQAKQKQLQKKVNITKRVNAWDNKIVEETPYYLMLNRNTFVTSVGLIYFFTGPRLEYRRKLVDNIRKKPYAFYMQGSKRLETWLSQEAINCLFESKKFDEDKLRIFPYSKVQQAYYYATTGKDWEEVLRKEVEKYEESKRSWRYQEIDRKPKQGKSWRKGAGKKKKRRK